MSADEKQQRPAEAGGVESDERSSRVLAAPEPGAPAAADVARSRAGAAPNVAAVANTVAPNVAVEPVVGEASLPEAPVADPVHAGEIAIASLLRWGVAAAALLLVLALTGSLLSGVPLGSRILPFGQLFGGGHALPPVLAQLGLITLAVTPLARVALAAGVFARAGEKRQTWIAVGVLALLAVALLLGAVEG